MTFNSTFNFKTFRIKTILTLMLGVVSVVGFSQDLFRKKIVMTSIGVDHSLALDEDGNVWAWGYNTYGQLGDNTKESKTSPVCVKPSVKFKYISAGSQYSLAIDIAGNIWAWGYNWAGQLGNGSTYSHSFPSKIETTVKFSKVSAGWSYVLAIDVNGNLWAWGSNDRFEFGNGTATNSRKPILIPTDVKFKEVNASLYSLGIDAEGKLYEWGNIYSTPTHIRTEKRFLTVDEGSRHCIGLEENGSLFTWGTNDYGQLGNVVNFFNDYSAQTNTSIKFKSVSAGEFYSMAIDDSGAIWAWGFNAYGQHGSGVAAGSLSPIKIESDVKFVSISTGKNNTLAVDESGQLWSCGDNQYGFLGIGTCGIKFVPVQIQTDAIFVKLYSRYATNYAFDSDNNLWAWGGSIYNESFRDGAYANQSKPVLIQSKVKYRLFSTKFGHTCAIDEVGNLWSWGYNAYGQLGDGTWMDKNLAVPIKPDTKFSMVSVGGCFTLAIDSMENLWAWGLNYDGQFGKKIGGSNSPTLIETKTKFRMLATGNYHALAIDSLGYLWAWGDNNYGQLGDGTRVDRDSPVQILPSQKFKTIEVGRDHSFAIDEEGHLFSWGRNNSSQLGLKSKIWGSLVPLPVLDTMRFKSVSVSDELTLAIDVAGNLWSWGPVYNNSKDIIETKDPYIVLPGTKFKLISAGERHCIAIDESDRVWAWGQNKSGQLGTGDAFSEHFIKLNDVHFVPVSSFRMSPDFLNLELDSVAQISIKIVPTNATDQRIEWTSSNESVASVDSLGYVKAVGVGFATINAKSVDLGQTKQVSVYVIKKTIPDAVDDVDNNQVLMVYPNPVSNGEVSVRLSNNDEKAQMSLYNSIGQKVASGTMEAGEIGRIDCRTLRSGIYILQVSTPSRQLKQSICIQ